MMKKIVLCLLLSLFAFPSLALAFAPSPFIVEDVILVNKHHPLPKDYAPLVYDKGEQALLPEVQTAFLSMQKDAKKEGLSYYLLSGYRDYKTQAKLYQDFLVLYGKKAHYLSAKPGYSEHQTGLALDLYALGYKDLNPSNKAGKWLSDNAHQYGFILHYPKGSEAITGYQYEPWHFRYVGKKIASEMKALDIPSLEAYLGTNQSMGRALAYPKTLYLKTEKEGRLANGYIIGQKTYLLTSDFSFLLKTSKKPPIPYVILLQALMQNEAGLGGVNSSLKTAKPYTGEIEQAFIALKPLIREVDKAPYLELRNLSEILGYKLVLAKENNILIISLSEKEKAIEKTAS